MSQRIITLFMVAALALLTSCSGLKNTDKVTYVNNKSSKKSYAKSKRSKQQLTSRIIKLRAFNKIRSEGPIHVEVIAGISDQNIRLLGPKSAVNKVSIQIRKGALLIGTKKDEKIEQKVVAIVHAKRLVKIKHSGSGDFTAIDITGPFASIDLNTSGTTKILGRKMNLNELILAGTGSVNIKGLKSDNLNITASGTNHVTLRGEANIRNMKLKGAGRIDMYWVKSHYLKIKGEGNVVVKLGGLTDLLEADLRGNAHLKARYLRTMRAFVKTYDTALAELQVTKSQNTLASDKSNIFFYKKSKFHGKYMSKSGAVLNMDGMS